MHIIIGLLGSLVTVLWLLHRLAEMGIDLGGLNPWLWKRRRNWKKTYEANPIYSLESPMEVTALLVAATAKADGDMTSEEKKAIREMFENTFHLSKTDAAGLLISSTHLLGTGEELRNNLGKIVEPSRNSFSESQAESAVQLLRDIANVGGEPSEVQQHFISAVETIILPKKLTDNEWA